MASLIRRKYKAKDKNGKIVTKQSAYWYIDYKGPDGIRKRVKGFKDKTATTQLAAKLEKEAAHIVLEDLPPDIWGKEGETAECGKIRGKEGNDRV